jgi:hypothetical protein
VVVQVEALKRQYHECEEWRAAALERIIEMRPAIVVMSNSRWYLTQVSQEAWRTGLVRTLADLGARGIPTLLVQDTPRPGFSVPTCLARAAEGSVSGILACGFPRMRPRDEVGSSLERAAAKAVPGVSITDFSREICGTDDVCDPMRDGQVLYVDHDHLTASYAATFAPRFAALMRDAMARPTGASGPARSR